MQFVIMFKSSDILIDKVVKHMIEPAWIKPQMSKF